PFRAFFGPSFSFFSLWRKSDGAPAGVEADSASVASDLSPVGFSASATSEVLESESVALGGLEAVSGTLEPRVLKSTYIKSRTKTPAPTQVQTMRAPRSGT